MPGSLRVGSLPASYPNRTQGATMTLDLSDFFGTPKPAAPSAPTAPWSFTMRGPGNALIDVLPLRRLGDRSDPEGEHVILEVVGPPGAYTQGATIRSPLHGGPGWRTRIEEAGAVASCDLAPHVKDLVGRGGPLEVW